MYRQYEEPRQLEKELDTARERMEKAKAEYDNGEGDYDTYVDAYNDFCELKDRVNFAWQDEEYEEDMRRESEFYNEDWEDAV